MLSSSNPNSADVHESFTNKKLVHAISKNVTYPAKTIELMLA